MSTSTHRPKTPQATFDKVAPYYDRVNGLLSLGLDRRWRRRTIAALALQPGDSALDVATGTGALALEMVAQGHGRVSVTGCDLNTHMLAVAQQRAAAAGANITFLCCDAANMPFAERSFDAASLAFAIDDMPDRDACIAEIARVLRPGGRFVLLELSQPDTQPLKAAYAAYLNTFQWLRKLKLEGYDHLAQEIRGYRGAQAIAELLARHGFALREQRALTGGIARLHCATRQ